LRIALDSFFQVLDYALFHQGKMLDDVANTPFVLRRAP
jgi:hypothetical protein